ncbi:MAG: hypothetical protein EXR92_02990 [Gemmatimonadetes bacterium]|nr:hypothetical protein [Gemmatimonadota bacterium]
MENWIGVGVWIVLGALVGLTMKVVVRHPDEQPGHTLLLVIFGAFGALIGGMLGVGFFHFEDPRSLSAGGMAGALALSTLLTWLYRWGARALI